MKIKNNTLFISFTKKLNKKNTNTLKTNLRHLTKIILSSLILVLFTVQAYSQTNTYNQYIKNINFIDCKNLEFEIWLEWTGTNTQKFLSVQAGIEFNYAGMANGGVITGGFVAGTADPSLPASQQSPSSNVNQTSKQFRLLAAIATPVSVAIVCPGPPGIRLGKFKFTNTAEFTNGSTPNFVWKFSTGTSTTTSTKVSFYLGSATTGTDITVPSQHFVVGNPAAQCGGVTCAVIAVVDQITAPVCLGGTNDSAVVTLTGTGITATGTYSLDAGAPVPYTSNPFKIFGLLAGSHSLTVTTATPCTSNTAQFIILDGASAEDNNICTTDGCNSITGVFHSPITGDDGNACTTDGCNSLTGVFNTLITVDDGNPCTVDGCNSITGVFNTPVIVEDFNACTVDACSTINGAVSHTPVNTDDGNICTTSVYGTSIKVFYNYRCIKNSCN